MESLMPKLLRAAAFVVTLILPALAWAQGSLLQGGLAPPGHVPMYSGPSSAATIVGDSGSANGTCSGGPVNCGLSEFLQEDRAPGLGPFGTNSCFYDLGETHYLCFDANAAGRGLIAFGAVGNAASIPLTCIINGVTQNCLGTANIVPPVTLTDNKTGPITDQNNSLCVLSQPGLSPQTIFDWTQGNFAGPTPTVYSAVCGAAVATQGTTTGLVNAIGGFLQVDESTGVFPTGVVLFGAGAVTRNNGQIWGGNVTLTDAMNASVVSAGTGRGITGYEADIQFTSTGSNGFGFLTQGNSIVQPAGAVAFSCGPLSLTPFVQGTTMPAAWSQCFESADGAAPAGLVLGRVTAINPAVHPQANLNSQTIALGFSDSATTPQNIQISGIHGPTFGAAIGGGIKLAGTDGLIHFILSPGGVDLRGGVNQNLNVGGPIDLADGVSVFSINDNNNGLQSMEIDALNLSLRAQNAVTVVANGGLVIPVGTPASSGAACGTGEITFDSAFVYTCVSTNTWRRVATSAF